jgi:DNA end-binding protein Ku
MPRPLWRGSLSFGLVNVPVALMPAVRDTDVRFHQIDRETGARLRVQRVCKAEDRPVEYDELARGYPRSDGDGHVLLTDAELEAVQPERTRTIDIAEFVPLADVDPIFFDHPYVLVPAGDGDGPLRAYRLLVEALEGSERVAIGRVVLRTKEHLVAIRVREGLLSLVTMRFADEVRPLDDLPLPDADDEPAEETVGEAVRLIERLAADWDPARYEDRHNDRLARLVRDKRRGRTIAAPAEPEAPAAVPDLMAALRESLKAAQAER